MQLLYYLRELKKANINAKGILLYPEEKKRIEVELTDENIYLLERGIDEIMSIINKEIPPPLVKIKYCKSCGYREYCYS